MRLSILFSFFTSYYTRFAVGFITDWHKTSINIKLTINVKYFKIDLNFIFNVSNLDKMVLKSVFIKF